jgi:uncharacterized membrane protein YhaH (DUF805 family)
MEATNEISAISAGSATPSQEASGRRRRKVFWVWVLAGSGLIGIASGIGGLILSFLAAESVVHPGSNVRLAVPILIVSCLSLFILAAHAMDRLHNLRK